MAKGLIRKATELIQPHVPNSRTFKSLVYIEPVGHILQGFIVDSSRWQKNEFYVHALAQPLYHPAETYNLGAGRQFYPNPRSRNWDINDHALCEQLIETILTEGMHFISEHSTFEQLLDWEYMKPRPGLYAPEYAYTLMMLGRYEEAAQALESQREFLSPDIVWQAETLKREEEFISLCRLHPERVQPALAEFERANRMRLLGGNA